MKGILEFNLNDPDDAMAHLRCVKSLDMAIALFDIINIKSNLKHQLDGLDKQKAINLIFDAITDAVSERGVNINELIV